MKEIKLKVVPSFKTSMFVWLNTIYIQSGFLTVASDKCLTSSLAHELGHVKQRKIMLAIVSVSLVIFLQVMILMLPMLSVSSLGLMFFLFYLWLCFFCRLGEFKADEHALKNSSKSGMIEMLSGEGSRMDTRLARLFFLIRLHPTSARRLRNLGLSQENV